MRLVRLVSAVRIAVLATAASASFAADIVLTPPSGGGVAVTNAAGTVNQFRVVDGETTLIGNFTLDDTTATTGILRKAGSRFIHNFGVDNTFMGVGSGNLSMTGTANTSFGMFTLRSNTTGYNNAALGAGALFANTTGFQNAAVGDGALNNNTTGNRNTATGANSMNANVSGNQNTAHGVDALRTNFGGSNNTAVGVSALDANFFGSQNTAVGALALNKNTSGLDNTATGWNSLGSNTTGFRNTGLGQAALFANTFGNNNTAAGISSLGQNASGSGNTAVGATALMLAGQTTTAGAFVAGVSYTIQTTGSTDFTVIGAANSNAGTVFVATSSGSGTGTASSNASNNIALGAGAGSVLTTGSTNIAIGHGGVAGVSLTTWIGQTQTRAFVAGARGVTTGVNDALPMMIDSAGQLGTVSSSRRFKDDVVDMGAASNDLMKLRPVSFYYKADQGPNGRRLQYGLIAEEVAQVYPQLVAYSADGQAETVMYQYLPTMLLNEFQSQQILIESQAARIESLERDLAAIKRSLGLR